MPTSAKRIANAMPALRQARTRALSNQSHAHTHASTRTHANTQVSVLRRFFEHIIEVKPTIFVTFNGDWFDWPFVDARAKHHGIDMMTEIGFGPDSAEEYKSRHAIHMDAFRCVPAVSTWFVYIVREPSRTQTY